MEYELFTIPDQPIVPGLLQCPVLSFLCMFCGPLFFSSSFSFGYCNVCHLIQNFRKVWSNIFYIYICNNKLLTNSRILSNSIFCCEHSKCDNCLLCVHLMWTSTSYSITTIYISGILCIFKNLRHHSSNAWKYHWHLFHHNKSPQHFHTYYSFILYRYQTEFIYIYWYCVKKLV